MLFLISLPGKKIWKLPKENLFFWPKIFIDISRGFFADEFNTIYNRTTHRLHDILYTFITHPWIHEISENSIYSLEKTTGRQTISDIFRPTVKCKSGLIWYYHRCWCDPVPMTPRCPNASKLLWASEIESLSMLLICYTTTQIFNLFIPSICLFMPFYWFEI